MNISSYQEQVDEWIKTIGVKYFSELTNMCILTEEVGELSRLISRIYGEQSFKKPMSEADQRSALADEMADVMWVLVCLANQTGIDLEHAVRENIKKKTIRDAARHRNNPKLK